MSEKVEEEKNGENEEKAIMEEIRELEKKVKDLSVNKPPKEEAKIEHINEQKTPDSVKREKKLEISKIGKEQLDTTIRTHKLKEKLDKITKPFTQWIRAKLIERLKDDLKKGKKIDLANRIGNLSSHWWKIPPKNKKALQRWKERWGNALLVIGKKKGQFLFDLKSLLHQFPLTDDQGGMRLQHLQKIIEFLKGEGLARWLNKEQTTAVIFWQTRKEIVEKVYQEVKQLGVPFIRLEDLRKVYQLPLSDLDQIMQILSDEGERKDNIIFFKKNS